MARLLLTALAIMGALTAGSVLSQTPPPVPRNTYIAPRPLPFAPRPNGAFACFVDAGPALNIYSPLPSLAGHDLSGQVTWSMRQTNDQCRATCGSQNFIYAGTQSGARCAAALRPIACRSPARLDSCPPQVQAAPANGGQCVIDLAGPGYRDVEVQRWEVTGPPTMGTTVCCTRCSGPSMGAGDPCRLRPPVVTPRYWSGRGPWPAAPR